MNKKQLLALPLLLFVTVSLHAQTFQEGFFLSDYRLGYHINPAFAGGQDFISIGEFSQNMRNNVGASAFLYPNGGEVLTALHSRVPADTFLGRLKDDNYLLNDYRYTLFAYGFGRGEAFHTVELNVRALIGASAPKELFRVLKLGTTDPVYDLSRGQAQGQLYAELAYGYTRRLSDVVTVGGRAKLLLGLNAVDYRMTRLDLKMDGGETRMDLEAELALTGRNKRFLPTEDGYLSVLNMTSNRWWRLPVGGGLAVDLGVVVTPNEYWTLSASVLDLGALCWSFPNAGKSVGSASFKGLDLAYSDLNKDALMKQLKAVGDDFLATLKLKSTGGLVSMRMIPFRANLGVKYRIPVEERLQVGVVASYIGYQFMPYWEARGGVSFTPLDWLDFAGSIGYGAYGTVWGLSTSVRVLKFRLNLAYGRGFGGNVAYSSTPVEAQNKVLTVGLTYDL